MHARTFRFYSFKDLVWRNILSLTIIVKHGYSEANRPKLDLPRKQKKDNSSLIYSDSKRCIPLASMIPGGNTGSVAVAAVTATFATASGGVNRGPTNGIWFDGLATRRTYNTQVNYSKKKHRKRQIWRLKNLP